MEAIDLISFVEEHWRFFVVIGGFAFMQIWNSKEIISIKKKNEKLEKKVDKLTAEVFTLRGRLEK